MPRLRRKLKSRTAWTGAHRRALELHDWFGNLFVDDEHEAAAWDHFRDEVMPEWIQKKPGTRPRAWWKFDMPPGTRRERIDGKPHPHDQGNVDPDRRLFRGMPARVGLKHKDAAYESEESFLERHSLLSDAEVQALEKMERVR